MGWSEERETEERPRILTDGLDERVFVGIKETRERRKV